MQIQVNVNNLKLIEDNGLNENEYNIHNVQFLFSNEYTANLAKVALFTSGTRTYSMIIQNNQCNIPAEILANQGCFTLGVYAFEVQENQLQERFSPTPIKLFIENGSYITDGNIENSEPITPTDKEQILSILAEMQEEYNETIQEVNTAIEETNNLNIDITKDGKTATVTLTKKDGTTKTVEIDDGTSLEFMWQGTSLGIKTDDQSQYTFVDLKGATGATPNIQIGTVTSGDTPSVTITGTPENPILNFTLVKGDKGDTGATGATGATGNGIASIEKTGTQGLVDTYTITYTDGTTTTFTVTNGEDGEVTQAQFDELQGQVDTLEDEVEDLENNQLISPPVSGTSIYLDDSANAKNRSIGITGNVSQNGEPSPINLVPINNTGDEGYINEKVQNKNLIPFTNQDFTLNGVRYYVQNGSLYLNGTSSGETTTTSFKDRFPLTLPAGTYYFNRGTNINMPTYLKKYSDNETIVQNSGSFTLNEETQCYVAFYVYQKSFNNTLATVQINVGSTAGTYVAHEEQVINFPLAQGQKFYGGDYLADSGIHHVMKEETVNGTTATFNDAKNNGAYYCNQKTSGNLTGQTITFDTSVTNAIVQYELATEIIEAYTEEQQIVWNKIKALKTYKNVTNINSSNSVPATVNIVYVKDLETVINNLSN